MTPPNEISCISITLDYNKIWDFSNNKKIVKNPFLTYMSYFSSCCSAKQLLAQRSGPEEVRQCTSCAVLASREWDRFVRGRDNLFMHWLGVIHGPLLQNLVSVWRQGWLWNWSLVQRRREPQKEFSTICFWLQRKGQPQEDSQQVAFYCSPEILLSERDAGSATLWPCGLTISDNWRGKKKVRRFETRIVRHGCWTV